MTAEISLLGKFITGLLVTPQSNADYERLFSMVRENKTELHSSMTVDTLLALIAVRLTCSVASNAIISNPAKKLFISLNRN